MHPTRITPLIGALSAIFVLGLTSTASADDVQWNRQKGDCEYVLKAPDRYPLTSVQECTITWEQYKDVSRLSPDERSLFGRGFSWLYLYGDVTQKNLAQGALTRIGKTKPMCLFEGTWRDPNIGQRCDNSGNDDAVVIKPLPRIVPTKAKKRAQKKAKKLNSKGLRAYKKKRYSQAVSLFKQSLKQDPFYVKAKYNLACNQALLGDADSSIRTLLELQSWEDFEAQSSFQKARTDRDFSRLHNDPRFRRLVGLIRVQLLNGAEEVGLYHVGRIFKALKTEGYYIPPTNGYGYDRHIRKRPLVYYRNGYEPQAKRAKEIVANARTAEIKIDFDTPFDLIIVWGDPDVAEREGVAGPIVHGEEAGEAGDASKAFFEGVNNAKGKVDQVKGAAEPPALPGMQ